VCKYNNFNKILILFYFNSHPDTFDHMTKPKEMHDNVVNTMQYLDTKLPAGSHVLLTGLANGSYLYAILSDRIHPIGRVKNDVQYKDVYTFLSCLQISPCNGWLTINDTERQITTETAVLLSEVIKNVTLTNKFKNFDMEYIDFPSDEMFQRW
jgi:acyloxyacyl hydrolase